GILAIGAEKLGAKSITAIDNDTWAYQNTKENVKANACSRISATLGDATLLGAETFDIILANINLNILLADMKQYVKCLANNGILIMSGILQQDLKTLEAEVLNQGLLITNKSFKNDWAAVIAIKANKP
ncbi:MAG TPA: 50S ribosomal protein L11 methyltransferase, partial [Tenuifilaceae bacterium]|nr:50S ribosomal protein L11 methyltransferase [Tenuifilaceae bacterium]